MGKNSVLFTLLSLCVLLASCEEEYIPDTVFTQPDLVIEGYVENGEGALPPYLILTRSSPYLTTLDSTAINALFVHGADVRVSDGQTEIQLTEICLDDLAGIDTALANSFLQGIGVGGDAQASGVNFCVYIEANAFLTGQSALDIRTGGRYTLRVQAEGKTATATTTLPSYIPIDSFSFAAHPDFPANDSLVQIYGYFTDPVGEENYYRIFSKRNEEPMYPATSLGTGTSVTDDKIFNGQSFQFDLLRGQARTAEFDFQTFGYFWRGDTVIVRGSTLDRAHFRFWQTVEFNTGREGPFTSYVRIQSNINGGLGIWGGVSFEDYRLIVPN